MGPVPCGPGRKGTGASLERLYHETMGNPNLEREAKLARTAYLGALQRLAEAMNAFNEAAVPLEPDEQGELTPWARTHVQVMRACALAWPDVVEKRREYDGRLRALRRHS